MKKTVCSILFCSILILGASCSQKVMQLPCPNDNLLSLSVDHIDISPTGSSSTIAFTADGDWTMNSDASWLSVSQKSGKEGTHQIKISADVNRTRLDRTTLLRFSSTKGALYEIPVNQPYPYLKLSIVDDSGKTVVQNDSVLFKWNNSQQGAFSGYKVKIESNVDWNMSFDEGYHSSNYVLSQQSGRGDATVIFTTEKNNIDKQPFVSVFRADAYMPGESPEIIGEGVDSYKYGLSQKNLRFLLDDSCDDINVSIDELNKKIVHGSIFVDSELPWKVKHCPQWVIAKSGFALKDTLIINADGVNPVLVQRKDSIVLQSDGLAERVIHVIQDPYIFTLSDKEIALPNNSRDTLSVLLETTGTWEITNVPQWLTVSKTEGEGDSNILFSCPDQNLNLEDLVQDVIFKSRLNTIQDKVKVSQNKYLFNMVPDEILGRIPTFNTNLFDVNVECSGDWTVSSDRDWVNLQSTSGTGSSMFKAGANSPNPDIDNDRVATLKMVSLTHQKKGMTVESTIQILQRKFIFEINVASTTVPAYTKTKEFVLNIDCTSEWEITAWPAWLTPTVTKGEGTSDVAFEILTNDSKSSTRTGKIKVKSTYNGKEKTTSTLTQEKFVFNVDKSSFYSLAPVNAAECHLAVSCTPEAEWTMSSENWVTSSVQSGVGSSDLTFTVKDNPKTTSRSAQLALTCPVIGETINISFGQNAYRFSSSALSQYSIGELETDSKSFSLSCSGYWEIETKNTPWIHFDKTSGNGDATISFYLDKNVNTEARNVSPVIYSTLQKGTADELKNEFKVVQNAYKFNGDPVSYTMETVNDDSSKKYGVSIVCSGGWKVNNVPSWMSVSKSSGSSSTSIDFVPSTNTNMSLRSVQVEIVSTDNDALKKLVNLSQSPYVFSLDKTSTSVTAAESKVSVALSASSAWTASSDKAWLTPSVSSGTGNASVTITAAKNDSKSDRVGIVTFTSKHGHIMAITVTQSK